MTWRFLAPAAVLVASLTMATTSARSAPLSTMAPSEIQAIQSREFDAAKGPIFASVLEALQNFSFKIVSADLNTGFISAESPTTSTGNVNDVIWGGATANIRATAFVETMANGRTRVRLNFASRKNRLGWSATIEHHETAIVDTQLYRDVFEAIYSALSLRTPLEKPVSPVEK